MMILAQLVEDSPFFSTSLGMMVAWFLFVMGGITIFSAGVLAIRTLWRTWQGGRDVLAENYRKDRLLDQILASEGWPNGATNILESHKDIYSKVASVEAKVDALTEAVQSLTDRPA